MKRKYDDYAPIFGAVSNIGRAIKGFRTARTFVPAVDIMFPGAGLGTAMTLGAGIGAAGIIATGAGVGYLAGKAMIAAEKEDLSQTILMPGNYQGKFALSARNAFKGLRDEYQKRGAVYIIENYGQVADPDIVYIGQSSWNIQAAVSAIGIALLRKLFKVGCNINPQTSVEELALISQIPDSGPGGYRVVYETRDSNGTRALWSFDIDNNSSLETILNQLFSGQSLYNILFQMLTEVNPNNLEKVYLFAQGTPQQLVYQMDLGKEILSVAMSSHMVVQNRTKAATDASGSITQVDVQPLKGPVFEFSVGVPKLKAESPIALNQMENQGLILVRAGQFGGTDTTAYKEPPVKNAFQKCVKSGYVRLNPGALKSMTIGTDITGYFSNVLFRLRVCYESTQTKMCYGKSQMVVLEEELNSGSSNNITVQYECQHIAGAHLTTTNNPNMQPGYASSVINNVPV